MNSIKHLKNRKRECQFILNRENQLLRVSQSNTIRDRFILRAFEGQ
jgi:hypothetical protein